MCNTYSECETLSHTRKRKLANNTYLTIGESTFGVRLHDTEIITFFADGRIRLDSGGWRTVTTKERMNRYLPAGWGLWQSAGVWYLGKRDGEEYAYADGCVIHADGSVTGTGPDPKAQAKLRKRIKAYAKAYVRAFLAGDVPKPGAIDDAERRLWILNDEGLYNWARGGRCPNARIGRGDCFYCVMRDVKTGRVLGDRQEEHLLSHIDEPYYVPSLLHNALERFPASRAAMSGVYDTWETGEPSKWLSVFSLRANGGDGSNVITQQVEKSLRRYLYEQLGTAS